MIAVTFQKGWTLYNAGETAGFDEATAGALIKAGVAVPHAPPAPADDQAAPPAPAKKPAKPAA
jgi:hypothetical protein